MEYKDKEFIVEYDQVIKDDLIKEAEDVTPLDLLQPDLYLNIGLGIQISDEGLKHAIVKRQAIDEDGQPNNYLTNSRAYKIGFVDRQMEVLTANLIAKNVLLAQVDDNGHQKLLLDKLKIIGLTPQPFQKGMLNT